MAVVSRQADAAIENGNTIDADDLDAEFDSIINELNSKETRLDNLESATMTIAGVKTFSSNPKTDGIDEKTTDAGVDIDVTNIEKGSIELDYKHTVSSVNTSTDVLTTSAVHGLTTEDAIEFTSDDTLPGGLSAGTVYYARVATTTTITVHTSAAGATADTGKVDITSAGAGNIYMHCDPASPAEGKVWYNRPGEELKYQNASGTQTITPSGYPKLYANADQFRPEFVSTTQVKIPTGLTVRSDDDTEDITFTSDETIDITTTTGAAVVNALMNGLTESSDTWYYIWVIAKASGASPKGLINTSASTISAMPTDYTVRRLVGRVRNDGSSNFLDFTHIGNQYFWNESMTNFDSAWAAGTMTVLDGGTATTPTAIDLSDFVPPESTQAWIQSNTEGSGYCRFRATGGNWVLGNSDPGAGGESFFRLMPTNTSQSMDYELNAGTTSVDVAGFILPVD